MQGVQVQVPDEEELDKVGTWGRGQIQELFWS